MSSITDATNITSMVVNPDSMVRKIVTLPHSMVEAIATFRHANRISAESEAIRRLIDLGLRAADKAPHSITPTEAEDVR